VSDIVSGTCVDQRPHLGRLLQRVADLERADRFQEVLFERLVHRLVHQHPAGGGAFLPGIEKGPFGGKSRGLRQVRILPDDKGIFTAQLELDAHQPLS
jgi:hypothetical protein